MTLALIDRFLAMPDQAQAHCDRAEAYRSLSRLENAARSYEDALNRESVFPRLETTAWIELPFMIAMEKMEMCLSGMRLRSMLEDMSNAT